MRVIKFRGYQPELKKWVYGDLIQVPDWATFIFESRNNFEDRIKVDSDSVGQFTGLLDKNGKEIYEGDICKIHALSSGKLGAINKEWTVEIKWNEKKCAFVAVCITEPSLVWEFDDLDYNGQLYKYEVIRNIYSND